jgi:hypothetical protein
MPDEASSSSFIGLSFLPLSGRVFKTLAYSSLQSWEIPSREYRGWRGERRYTSIKVEILVYPKFQLNILRIYLTS